MGRMSRPDSPPSPPSPIVRSRALAVIRGYAVEGRRTCRGGSDKVSYTVLAAKGGIDKVGRRVLVAVDLYLRLSQDLLPYGINTNRLLPPFRGRDYSIQRWLLLIDIFKIKIFP